MVEWLRTLALCSNPWLSLCVTLGKLLHLSVLSFPHLENGHHTSTDFTRLL